MAAMKLVHTFAGRELLSDKVVRSIEGPIVLFEDGSRGDLATGGFTQCGPGIIQMRSRHVDHESVMVSDVVVEGSLIIQTDASGVSIITDGPAIIPAQRPSELSKPRTLPWYKRLLRWLRRRW